AGRGLPHSASLPPPALRWPQQPGRSPRANGPGREAEQALRQAVEIRQKLVHDFPDVPDYRLALASSFDNLRTALTGPHRHQEAEQAHRQALEICAQLAADFPDVPDYRSRLAIGHYNLASQLANTGRHEEAERDYRRGLEIVDKLAADFPAVPRYQHLLGGTLYGLADVPCIRKDPAKAREFFERAVHHQQRAFQTNPKDPSYRLFLRLHYGKLAEVLVELGEHAEAAKTAAELPRLYPDRWRECFAAASFLARCVALARKDPRLSEARRRAVAQTYADQAIALLWEAIQKGVQG